MEYVNSKLRILVMSRDLWTENHNLRIHGSKSIKDTVVDSLSKQASPKIKLKIFSKMVKH